MRLFHEVWSSLSPSQFRILPMLELVDSGNNSIDRPTISPFPMNVWSSHINDSFGYSAWIIPLRGQPPFNDTTPALLVEEGETYTRRSVHGRRLLWTIPMIVDLLSYLARLREQRTYGTMGLALEHALLQRSASTHLSGSRVYPHSLQDVDHIKLYHTNRMSPFLRQELHLWKWVSYASNTNQATQILRGVRLALVDELSQLILVA